MRPLKFIFRVILLFILLFYLGGQPALASDASPTAPAPQATQPPDDAQSTTGPTPPRTLSPADLTVPGPEKPVALLPQDVPAYTWIHGCGPTAAGMIMAYWDKLGYTQLYPASNDTNIQNSSVEEMIASSLQTRSHYNDYAKPTDDGYPLIPDACTPPGCNPHYNNSMADFMLTSRYSEKNAYGWSWFSHMGPAMYQYVNYINGHYLRTYQPHTQNFYYNQDSYFDSSLWATYTAEIDAGHPVVFLVDSDGNGYTDHFVTGTGYSLDSDDQPIYRFNDTWDHDKNNWAVFQSMTPGDPWGIFGMVTFYLTGDDTPVVLDEHLQLPLILSPYR